MISVVLTCEIDGKQYSIVMDTVNSDSINSSIEITRQPLLNGEFISDHLFRQPISYVLNGEFGIGKKQGIIVNDGHLLLTEVQTIFEQIKNLGIVCSLVRVRIDDHNNREVRFLQRNNLILESIKWTEKIDTLGFDFTFKEIAFAESIEYDVDIDDANMPNVQELAQRSFSEALLSREDALKSIISFMYDNKIMSDAFWQCMLGNKAETFLGLGIGVGVAYALGSLIVACGTTPIVGWIVGIVVVAVALIGIAIAKIVRYCRYKVKPFDKYNEKELKRWSKLMEEISDEIATMSDHIQVYQPQEDKTQECILTVDGEVFVFSFGKNNVSGDCSLTIYNGKDEEVGGLATLGSAPTNYGNCNKENTVYKNTQNQVYMHILYTGENTKEEKSKLTNYLLTISNIEPEKFEEMMATIIKNYLLK